ncbi:MAG: hypothetical protein R2867_35340 [Caldilineaceae bacterium]
MPHQKAQRHALASVDTPVGDLRQAYGDLDATIIAYGHYHAHHVRQLDGKMLINVAAAGLGWSGLCPDAVGCQSG